MMTPHESAPFRSSYLSHDQIAAQLEAWAEAHPELCRLDTLGTTPEGRPLQVLVVGPEPERARPGVWVDGNMHACELAGSNVALAIAADALALHLDPEVPPHGLSRTAADVLREVLFYVMPRMSPDGAERVLQSGRFVRSSPVDDRPNRAQARWVHADIDGDGLALSMRVEDPAGEFVAHEGHASALRARTVDDEGPFYRLFPEGLIEGFDGETVPDPHYMSDNSTDLNRNFPVAWQPEPGQAGAGGFATSLPEARAVVEYTERLPHLFAWLNLHCFGGVCIRPLGDAPDDQMDPEELAYYRQLEAWNEEFVGYPTVSGFEEFTYQPDKPLYGDIVAWAHKARGCFAWVVEIWDLLEVIGIPRPKRFVNRYERMGKEELERLVRFDEEHNDGRLFPAWRPADHPQLGAVEVGGFDARFGLWNPPTSRLPEICRGLAAVFLRVAAMAPRVVVDTTVESLADEIHQVEVVVSNHGYLPTYVLPSARSLPLSEPLWVEVVATRGVDLVDRAAARRKLGHLEGWGRGRHNPAQSLLFPQSRGSSNRRHHRMTVRGAGEIVLRVGSCRVGWQTMTLKL